MNQKYSYWLPIEQIQDDHSFEVEKFVRCYTIFYGSAGKCDNCYAKEYCQELIEDSKRQRSQPER